MRAVLNLSRSLIIIAISLLYGCNTDDTISGSFSARVENDKIVFINLSDVDIFYFAVDQNTLAVINWAPGVGEDLPKAESNQVTMLSLNEVTGYSSETSIIVVYFWKAVLEDGVIKAGDIQSLSLDL